MVPNTDRQQGEGRGMEREEKGRSLGCDALSRCRGELMGLAMLWILFYHAFYLEPRWYLAKAAQTKGFCGVDIFLMLSALGLAMSLDRKQQPLGRFYLRRSLRVLPTYWLVVGLYGLALRLAGRASLKTVAWSLSTLFYWFHKPNIFNWYVPALLGFYLLTPLLFRLVKRCRRRWLLVGAVYLAMTPITTFLDLRGFSYLDDFLFRVPIFFAGLALGLAISEGRELTAKALAGMSLCVLAGPVLSWAYQKIGIYFSPVCVFMPICPVLCLGLARILLCLPERGLRHGLRTLGACSLEIYLLNVVFVREYDLLSLVLDLGPGHYAYYAITVTANILLGIGLHRLLKQPLDWLGAKVTGSASPSRPPKEEGRSAEDRSER